MRMKTVHYQAIAALLLCCCLAPSATADDAQAEQDATKIEILKRLDDIDINANENLKALVLRHLARIKGTDEYVDLVERFAVADVNDELLRLASREPTDNLSVKAARLLLRFKGTPQVKSLLANDDAKATTQRIAVINALGLVGSKPAIDLLMPIVNDAKGDGTTRSAAARAVGQSVTGQRLLLAMAKNNQMPQSLKGTFTRVLNESNDPEIRAQGGKLLPMPATKDAKPLSPISELIKRKGNPKLGPQLFERATCVHCHKAAGLGVDFGPALNEIGSKLTRQAMFVSILDPSAAVSHDYITTRIETDDGSQHVGIVVSEGNGVVTLKQQKGITQKLKADEIAERLTLKTSIMPNGLTAALTEQELIDLVEWLLTLKKPGEQQSKQTGNANAPQ